MYCLDTNIVVDILRGDEKLRKKVEEKLDVEEIFITPVTLCELFRGAFGHKKPEEKIKEVESFLLTCYLLEFNSIACKEFGRIYRKLKETGKLINEFDLMIASIVKAHNLLFITRDKKHFENIGIKVEVW